MAPQYTGPRPRQTRHTSRRLMGPLLDAIEKRSLAEEGGVTDLTAWSERPTRAHHPALTPIRPEALSVAPYEPIALDTPLDLRSSFAFPLQSAWARREVLIGAALLLIPVVGWLLNMGHRVMMVHRMLRGEPAWPSWRNYGELLRHGVVTFGGMVFYYLPGAALLLAARLAHAPALAVAGGVLLVLATLAIPGYMTHYCRAFDAAEIYDPSRALRRALED